MRKNFWIAILGVLVSALLFGCRATKKATIDTQTTTELQRVERTDFRSDWERFIKNNLNVTLEGIEIEFPSVVCDSDTVSVAGALPQALLTEAQQQARGNSLNSSGTQKKGGAMKIKVGKATIASNTEQVEKQSVEQETEATTNEKSEADIHSTEQVKNQTAETIDAVKVVVTIAVLLFILFIVYRWLKKAGKI